MRYDFEMAIEWFIVILIALCFSPLGMWKAVELLSTSM